LADSAWLPAPLVKKDKGLQILFDERVQRMSFVLWCLGWLIVAGESLRPIQTMPFGLSDKLIHFMGYALMSTAVASFCYEPRWLLGWSVLTLLIGGLSEVGQYFVLGRDADLLDFVANASGTILGATTALIWLLIVVRPLRRVLANA
jgi:VanZ family protein